MKAKYTRQLLALSGLLLVVSGTTCDAKPGSGQSAKAPAAEVMTPELAKADERVQMARGKLETAKKQLEAAKALVKAAAADFKAARADREALALRTRAEGLADASGLNHTSLAQRPSQSAASDSVSPAPAAPDAQATAPTPEQSTGDTRIRHVDFNAEAAPSEPLPLR